jgi:hypothetical protein
VFAIYYKHYSRCKYGLRKSSTQDDIVEFGLLQAHSVCGEGTTEYCLIRVAKRITSPAAAHNQSIIVCLDKSNPQKLTTSNKLIQSKLPFKYYVEAVFSNIMSILFD